MARNGTDFGIRVSGTGDAWFTGPANTPEGLFLGAYGPDDANPDIGDSAITETAGIGGFAMAAAPAIVRFVGGDVPFALRATQTMYEITVGEHPAYQVPILEFRGTPTGIDVTAVVRTGILPQINTGMAGRVAGTGQVGAGLVTPPRAVLHRRPWPPSPPPSPPEPTPRPFELPAPRGGPTVGTRLGALPGARTASFREGFDAIDDTTAGGGRRGRRAGAQPAGNRHCLGPGRRARPRSWPGAEPGHPRRHRSSTCPSCGTTRMRCARSRSCAPPATRWGRRDVSAMIRTPQAVWLTGDSPAEVEREARQVTDRAAGKREMPVLVAYNIPFRDCAQYSAGGAAERGRVRGLDRRRRRRHRRRRGRRAPRARRPGHHPLVHHRSTAPRSGASRRTPTRPPRPPTGSRMLNHAVDALEGARRHPRLPRRHAQRLAGRRRRRRPPAPGRRRSGPTASSSTSRTTSTTAQLAEVRRLDLAVHLRSAPTRRRAAGGSATSMLRQPVLPGQPADDTHLGLTRRLVRRQRRPTRPTRRPAPAGLDALRRRHQPQRSGAVDPAGRRLPATRRTGATRPAAASALRPDRGHRRPARRRLPLGQDARRVRRPVHARPRRRGGVDPEWGIVDPAAGDWFPQQALELARLAQPPL